MNELPTTTTSKTAAEVQAIVLRLPGLLAGQEADPTGLVNGLYLQLGETALELIHDAYLIKCFGGTDAAGIQWAPITERYNAYGREHVGLARKKIGDRPRGLLTDAQDKRWRSIYSRTYYWLIGKGLSDADASGNAAGYAWQVMKSEGARTMIQEYGHALVQTLVASGTMLEALTPGSGSPYQIVESHLAQGEVVIGVDLPYAGAHHQGNPAKGIPARPLWPDPDQLPTAWVDRFTDVLEEWTGRILERLVA